MIYHLLASCPEESKAPLISELEALGAQEIRSLYKAVAFKADKELFYRCHLYLRTASNLYWTIKFGPLKNLTDANVLAKAVPWSKYFDLRKSYRIDSVITDKGRLDYSGNDLSKTLRLAIEQHFTNKIGDKPTVDIKDPKVLIVIHQRAGFGSISISTSGMALHKRAYRTTQHPAPLKETVAATILKLAGYDGSQPLLDPFCGSGTIAIEAASMALDKACNIHRKKGSFGFEHLLDFDAKLFEKIKDQSRLAKKDSLAAPIFASDLQGSYVEDARENALRARVEKYIDFKTASFFDLVKPTETGMMIANLPYGERLAAGTSDPVEFFKKIGTVLKNQFTGWQIFFLVSDEPSWKHIGLKPKIRGEIMNGSIKTKLVHFEIYAGSKKAKKS